MCRHAIGAPLAAWTHENVGVRVSMLRTRFLTPSFLTFKRLRKVQEFERVDLRWCIYKNECSFRVYVV